MRKTTGRKTPKPRQPAKRRAAARKTLPSSAVRVNPDVAFRELDGHVLLLGPGDSTLFTLNGSGRFIWRLLVQRKAVDDIARALTREFGVSPDVARDDVATFIRELRSRRFVLPS